MSLTQTMKRKPFGFPRHFRIQSKCKYQKCLNTNNMNSTTWSNLQLFNNLILSFCYARKIIKKCRIRLPVILYRIIKYSYDISPKTLRLLLSRIAVCLLEIIILRKWNYSYRSLRSTFQHLMPNLKTVERLFFHTHMCMYSKVLPIHKCLQLSSSSLNWYTAANVKESTLLTMNHKMLSYFRNEVHKLQ